MTSKEHGRTPNKADIAITHYVVNKALAIPEYGYEPASDVVSALEMIEQNHTPSGLSNTFITKARSTINYLVKNGYLDPKPAEETLKIMDQFKHQSALPNFDNNLNLPIEEVAHYAKEELKEIIASEQNTSLVDKIPLTILEKAVLNLDATASWVTGNTWLRSYFDRTKTEILIHKPLINSLPLAGGRTGNLFYTSEGFTYFITEFDLNILTPKLLEQLWDRGADKFVVQFLAHSSRPKVAQKISRSIKVSHKVGFGLLQPSGHDIVSPLD